MTWLAKMLTITLEISAMLSGLIIVGVVLLGGCE